MALADRVLERHGTVDILVNAAGVFARGDAVDLTLERVGTADGARTCTSTYLLCQRFGKPMIDRGRGKIVNFSSTDGFLGVPEQLAYNVSKGAIVQLTRTLGAEWIRHGVNVNAVAPCDFATPMIEPFLDHPGVPRLDPRCDPRRARRPARRDRRRGAVSGLAGVGHGRRPQPAGRRRPDGHLSATARVHSVAPWRQSRLSCRDRSARDRRSRSHASVASAASCATASIGSARAADAASTRTRSPWRSTRRSAARRSATDCSRC